MIKFRHLLTEFVRGDRRGNSVRKILTNPTRITPKDFWSVEGSSKGFSTKSIFGIFLVMSLVGCDTVDNLNLGPWKEAGTRETPRLDPQSKIDVVQLAVGTGKTVAPGDLVKVRITPIGQALAERVSILESEAPWDLWLWVGREPDGLRPQIYLGDPNFRAALIGRSLHERLRIELNEAARKYVRLPLMGGMTDEWLERGTSSAYESDDRRLRIWPELAVSRAGALDVEILNACPGHLFSRGGQLERRPWTSKLPLNFDAESNLATQPLGWLRLEGRCAEGVVQLDVGPAPFNNDYIGVPSDFKWKWHGGWARLYIKLRPPSQFPQEYENDQIYARERPRRQIVEVSGRGEQTKKTECDLRDEDWPDPYPRLYPELKDAVAIFPIRYAMIRRKDGQIRQWHPHLECWEELTRQQREFIAEPGLRDIVTMASNHAIIYAITSDGALWYTDGPMTQDTGPRRVTWGKELQNSEVSLGSWSRSPRNIPLPKIAQVAVGYNHTLALTHSGDVLAFGHADDCGQLGLRESDNDPKKLPKIKGLPPVVAVAAGDHMSFVLTANGDVWGWGYQGPVFNDNSPNRDSHCPTENLALEGNGKTYAREPGPQPVPIKLAGLSDITAIAASYGRHLIALKRDGTVWGWGENECGELGIENPPASIHQFYSEAVQVEGLRDIRAIATTRRISMALRADGEVWAWGMHSIQRRIFADPVKQAKVRSRENARIYNGPPRASTCRPRGVMQMPYPPNPIPVIVPEVRDAIAIAIGQRGQALALTKDGQVWGWGSPDAMN